MFFLSSSLEIRISNFLDKASISPTGKTSPFFPSLTISGIPPTGVTTQGIP